MHKLHYTSTPARVTELSKKVLRCRLSLRETQAEFARRFRVSRISVWKWETGRSNHIQHIYLEILTNLFNRLQADGLLLPMEMLEVTLREAAERSNVR